MAHNNAEVGRFDRGGEFLLDLLGILTVNGPPAVSAPASSDARGSIEW